MEAKIELAQQIVSRYHGVEGAHQGKEEFQQKSRKREFPDEPDATVILKKADFADPATLSMGLVDLIMRTKLTPSKGETRRLITQGAIVINKERYQDVNAVIEFQDGNDYQMKIGKRKYALVKVKLE